MGNVYFDKVFLNGQEAVISGNRTLSGANVIESPSVSNTETAVNVTGAISASALAGGLITSTSVATVTATLPTATLLATELGAVKGTTFDFVVDNISGANIVTVAVGTGITAGTAVLTGGATLTVASGAVGVFKLIFTSTTAARIFRIA